MPTKIAIIEDNADISQLYRMKFEAEGFIVQLADNGRVGLELLESMRPDIVLLDMIMPEMNGDEVMAKLRATEWGKDMKVIILTNLGEQEASESLRSLNVCDFIIKANMTPKQVAELVKSKLSA